MLVKLSDTIAVRASDIYSVAVGHDKGNKRVIISTEEDVYSLSVKESMSAEELYVVIVDRINRVLKGS